MFSTACSINQEIPPIIEDSFFSARPVTSGVRSLAGGVHRGRMGGFAYHEMDLAWQSTMKLCKVYKHESENQ